MSGIFRDVYLLDRPQNCIFDYFVTTEMQQDAADLRIRLNYLEYAVPTHAKLYDEHGVLIGEADAETLRTKTASLFSPSVRKAVTSNSLVE